MTKETSPANAAGHQPAAPVPPWRSLVVPKSWVAAFVVVLVTCLAYLPAMRGGFVFDDHVLLTDNPMIRAGDGLYRFWFTTEAPDYWPLTSTLWWLEWRLWADRPAGYHVVNILLHALNAVLVWMILRRLKIPGAWLVALVFAVHPVNVATVAWISEQKNTLSMLLGAGTVLLFLRYDTEARWRWYGWSLTAFLLALLSKSAIVMLPVVLLGCIWWLHGRVTRKDVLGSLPFFVLSLVSGLATIWFQYHRAMGGHPIRTESFAARLAAAGWVPWFYLYQTLAPVDLTVVHPKWVIDASRWVSYLPGIILLGCLTVFWWKRTTWGRPWLFGLGYFVVMLFPVLGFFDQAFSQYSLVADHWQYCSIVGAIALSVAVGEKICRRSGEPGQSLGVVMSVAVLLVLGVGTWRRSCVYADSQTLWRDNVAKEPNAWVAHHNLGLAVSQSDRFAESVGHYEQALRIKPDYAEAHNNLGIALLRLGRSREAIAHWEQALRIKPDCAAAHYNLGIIHSGSGRVREAIAHYEQALRIKPHYAEAHYNLALALQQTDRIREAIEHYQQALRIKPDFAQAHYNLGVDLVRLGRVRQAIGHYEHALRIKPDYAEAHSNLGIALSQEGRFAEAIGHYEQALRIKPDYPEAQNNLSWLLATLAPAEGGDPVRAVALARRACELTGHRVAAYLDTLAATYAATDQFEDAIATAQQAVELARSAGQADVAREIEMRLELYRAGRARL